MANKLEGGISLNGLASSEGPLHKMVNMVIGVLHVAKISHENIDWACVITTFDVKVQDKKKFLKTISILETFLCMGSSKKRSILSGQATKALLQKKIFFLNGQAKPSSPLSGRATKKTFLRLP